MALATACAAFHRFSRAVGPAAPHDPHLVAAAALFLAGKAQGTPLRARDVLNVAHRYGHAHPTPGHASLAEATPPPTLSTPPSGHPRPRPPAPPAPQPPPPPPNPGAPQ